MWNVPQGALGSRPLRAEGIPVLSAGRQRTDALGSYERV
jgi:hypothetical protein